MRRITEHKRHVSKTEWPMATYNPMDDNDIVRDPTSGELVQSLSLCVWCVCLWVGLCV